MRRIIVITMISIDGVMQAPGAPGEDESGDFKYGGWVAPFDDEGYGTVMQEQMKPTDILLGRKTFQIFESYWPTRETGWPGINDVTKYVFSNTINHSGWENCIFLKDVAAIEKLKNTEGTDLKVWGSSKLVQLLLKNSLVDELWLIIHPVILGKGKKLFSNDATAAAYTLTESVVTTSGVIIANYKRAGEVKTGTIGG